jgi:hypothetical protein
MHLMFQIQLCKAFGMGIRLFMRLNHQNILIDPMFGEDAAQLHLSKSNDLVKYFSY